MKESTFNMLIGALLGAVVGFSLAVVLGHMTQPGFEAGYEVGVCTVHLYADAGMSEGAARAVCTEDESVRDLILDQPIRENKDVTA